jgi:hypothetical protein
MGKITLTGVGTADHPGLVRDSNGTGLLPIQADGDGAATFRVLARVAPDAPWVEIIAPAAADFLQSISWVPYVRLEITSGTGKVDLWVGEK